MTAPAGITLATLSKDLRLEWRSKDAINSMLFFALLVVVVFSFSFDPNAEESRHIAGGLIWVAFLFAAVVALNQTWAREVRNQVLDAYRVSPAPANSLFLAKALGNFIFVTILEAAMTPLFIVFYQLRSLGPAWQLLLVAGFGTWALGGQSETYNSGAYGSMAGQSNSNNGGLWEARGGQLFMSSGQNPVQLIQPFSVTLNSNGSPIINSLGKEYSRCN